MTDSWLLDELAHAGPEHLDAASVAAYDRTQGAPDHGGDLAELAAHGLSAESVVVDLGCGTGLFAIAAAGRFGRVIAVDVSEAMLEVARNRAAAAGTDNIDFVRAGFLSYRHPGPPADAVYSRNALHHLPDFWKALALERIAGMLRPGGMLRLRDLIFDAAPMDTAAVIESWLARAPNDPQLGYTQADLAEHVRNEFSTYRWLLEPMLDAAGFDVERATFSGSVYGAYTCVKR